MFLCKKYEEKKGINVFEHNIFLILHYFYQNMHKGCIWECLEWIYYAGTPSVSQKWCHFEGKNDKKITDVPAVT